MGYTFTYSCCISCKQPFAYNPHTVPSIRVNGVREPVCRNCMAKANLQRVAKGLDPFAIHPSAYEPLPEEEL